MMGGRKRQLSPPLYPPLSPFPSFGQLRLRQRLGKGKKAFEWEKRENSKKGDKTIVGNGCSFTRLFHQLNFLSPFLAHIWPNGPKSVSAAATIDFAGFHVPHPFPSPPNLI